MHLSRSHSLLGLLLVLTSADALAQLPLHRWRGRDCERFGLRVSGAGDLDADGRGDVLVYSSCAGHVTPANDTPVRALSGATGAELFAIAGPIPSSGFGSAFEELGDIDGDGRGDFAVGALGADFGAGVVGAVTAHSGLDGSLLWQHAGTVPDAFLGSALARTDDLDGDGLSDLFAIGFAWPPAAPRVELLSGADGALIWAVDGPVGVAFGWAAAALGDVDGDGWGELAVGAPATTSSINTHGAVHVLSGADGSTLQVVEGILDDRLGTGVCGPGDMDGDGTPDLATSGMFASVRIYSVQTGELVRTLALAGRAAGLDAAGDVDGDGTPDVLAGSEEAMYVLSGSDGAQLRRFFPHLPGAQVQRVVTAPDLDGDGRDDFLLGALEIEPMTGASPGGGELLAFSSAPSSDVRRSCFGDGSDGPCPCAFNPGSVGGGCPAYVALYGTMGARLFAEGSTSASADDLRFIANLERPTHPGRFAAASPNLAMLLAGTARVAPAPFGCGLLCAGGELVTLATWSGAGETATFGPGLGALGGWSGGQRRTFQVWYRQEGMSSWPFGDPLGRNTTNAIDVRFGP